VISVHGLIARVLNADGTDRNRIVLFDISGLTSRKPIIPIIVIIIKRAIFI
jgi:hypothetical protein